MPKSSTPENPLVLLTDPPAVMEASRWLAATDLPPGLPLINLSQAAPALAPPMELRQAMAQVLIEDVNAHLYGPDLGMPELRAELAGAISRHYGGTVAADQVAITAGCNQAFTAVMTTLAQAGDEILLPTPWYFNHKMHCDMNGIGAVPLPTGDSLIPDPEIAARLITDRTRAIVLVTPNNPGGVEYPPEVIHAFRDLARARGLALVIDETYRDFHGETGAPHDLFADPDWADTVIHLYSFSKAFRLTGHRVGAIAASTARLALVEKYIDTTTICANQLGQRAALWGLRNLTGWLAGERAEILRRRAVMAKGFAARPDWQLMGLGAYFAYVRHPFAEGGADIARRLLAEAGILVLPGTMFRPATEPQGAQELRIAFANADTGGLDEMFRRLDALRLPLAPQAKPIRQCRICGVGVAFPRCETGISGI